MPTTIELRFFASVREKLGISEEKTAVPDNIRTVGDVRAWLSSRGEPWSEVLAEGRVLRMALDHEMCEPEAEIHAGCEVAFFPPVTGG